METASLFIQKVCVVLSVIASHVTVSDVRKAPHALRVGARILIKGKSTKAVEVCLV